MTYLRKIINGPPCEINDDDDDGSYVATNYRSSEKNYKNNFIDWMCDFSKAQTESRSTDGLIENWIKYFQSVGISIFSYYHRRSDRTGNYKRDSVMAHYGLPDAWKNSYLLQGFCEDDPLMCYAFEKNELFKFSDLSHFKSRTPREKKYFESFQRLNLSEGYALPIFDSGHCHGFFALGISKEHSALKRRQLAIVNWACQMGHYRYVDLMNKEKEIARQLGAGGIIHTQHSAQLSDKQAAAKVVAELKHANISDIAQDKNETYLFQVASAMKFGYEEPFSEPQRKLNYALMKMTASKEVTHDAWKLYHMLRQIKQS